MVCLCTDTMMKLRLALPSLSIPASSFDVSASAHASLNASLGLGSPLQALAAWLAEHGLPAEPWNPDPAWLETPLPTLTLDASAIATLQAFVQLQMLALSLGLDLTVQAQATAFARLVATVNARLSALLEINGPHLDASAWSALSASMTASAQVTAALRLNLFPVAPAITIPPRGPSLDLWRAFLQALRALLPVIAIALQLKLDLRLSLSEQLAPMLRIMLRIPMPVMTAQLSLMASLTAALSAIAQLRLSLGIDPLRLGLPAVRLMVAERLQITESLVQETTGRSSIDLMALLSRLRLPYCPTLMAPPAVVHAAFALNMPRLNWQVPALIDLPVLNVGLPVAAFAAQLKASMDLQAALSPCAVCDAKSLLAV